MAHSILKDYKNPILQNCTINIEVIISCTTSAPIRVVFRFLSDGVNKNESFTFQQLETLSKAPGGLMQKAGSKGDYDFRAKLLVTSGRQSNTDLSLILVGQITKSEIERNIAGRFSEECALVSIKNIRN